MRKLINSCRCRCLRWWKEHIDDQIEGARTKKFDFWGKLEQNFDLMKFVCEVIFNKIKGKMNAFEDIYLEKRAKNPRFNSHSLKTLIQDTINFLTNSVLTTFEVDFLMFLIEEEKILLDDLGVINFLTNFKIKDLVKIYQDLLHKKSAQKSNNSFFKKLNFRQKNSKNNLRRKSTFNGNFEDRQNFDFEHSFGVARNLKYSKTSASGVFGRRTKANSQIFNKKKIRDIIGYVDKIDGY